MYTIPFTEKSVKEEICGRRMVEATKKASTSEVNAEREFVLEENAGWRIEGGVLCLVNERDSVVDEINCVEVAEGVTFLGGEALHRPLRVIVYEREALGTDYRIVVSSHVGYEEKTISRLVRSLVREGGPEDCITIVVGGGEEEGQVEVTGKGYNRIEVKGNLMGLTGIIPLLDGRLEIPTGHVLMLHDTCEAIPGFRQRIESLDVGIPYDMVQGLMEIGLWSMNFIRRLGKMQGLTLEKVNPYNLFETLMSYRQFHRKVSNPNVLRSKDVYGAGVPRQVLELEDLGIKKYTGNAKSGGRP